MKKAMAILCALCLPLTLALSGCEAANKGQTGPSNTPAAEDSGGSSPSITAAPDNTGIPGAEMLKAKDYYPIYENVRIAYEGKGNEFAFFNKYIDYSADGKAQERTDNGGTQAVRVVEVRDDSVVQTVSRGEVYYRENLLNAKGEEEVLLKEPLEVGNSWTLSDSGVREITGVSVDVSTPSGNYKAVEVTTESPNGTSIDYYAKDVGLVKTIFKGENSEISSALSKIEKDEPFVQPVNFYYPGIEDESVLYYISREVTFHTNDITRQVLEAAYKEDAEDGVGKVFTKNTKINSLYLNADGMAYIDLSKDYLTEMSAGAGFESAMLQCIANTFGQYYNVKRVMLTIDGEPYSSGHIGMEKGQYLEVNYDISKSIKD